MNRCGFTTTMVRAETPSAALPPVASERCSMTRARQRTQLAQGIANIGESPPAGPHALSGRILVTRGRLTGSHRTVARPATEPRRPPAAEASPWHDLAPPDAHAARQRRRPRWLTGRRRPRRTDEGRSRWVPAQFVRGQECSTLRRGTASTNAPVLRARHSGARLPATGHAAAPFLANLRVSTTTAEPYPAGLRGSGRPTFGHPKYVRLSYNWCMTRSHCSRKHTQLPSVRHPASRIAENEQPATASPQRRAALYIRVSGEDQSLDNQRPDLTRLADARALHLVGVFEEKRSAAKSRPEYDRMMTAAHKGEFRSLLVWSLDRFGRSMVGNMMAVLELDRLGVQVISVREPWLDTSGPVRALLIAIFSWVAEQERIRISERTKAGLERARRNGARLGRPAARIDLTQAVALRAAGHSIRVIAAKLGVTRSPLQRALADFPGRRGGGAAAAGPES
jgi:putative DNA-invertase from lambdoid prophage Rac